MTLLKLIGIVFCMVFLVLLIKQYKPEFVLPIMVCGGCLILFSLIGQIDSMFISIRKISDNVGINILYIEIIFKIIGISYLCEFASSVCKDCGQSAFSAKIDLAGKLLILSSALPVFDELLKIITSILP